MTEVEIAKRLLICEAGDSFPLVYREYRKSIKISRKFKNYHKVDLTTTSDRDLRAMLDKLNDCFSHKTIFFKYDLPFNFKRVEPAKDRIFKELRKRDIIVQSRKISAPDKRKAKAKLNRSYERCKNR